MNKLLLFFALLLIPFILKAQNKAVIKGQIIDSLTNTPIEFATIAVLDTRDTTSTLLAYTLSDKTGNFNLHNLPSGIPLKVLISFVAYKPYRKLFILKKAETLDLGNISVSAKLMNEVLIKGERMPIVVRKDTIEFDAEAFKTRPNAVVEDLLKKLPGIEVANDGIVTVQGKTVTKILVDGREFFVNDPRIATKNLDADMIAKVQVYDDRENDPNHRIPTNLLNKIINLKFKKVLKKSLFGKVYGGGGTQEHYQAGTLINLFRDTLQVSLLGLTNNLNSTGFDFNDLYTLGGIDRGGDALSGASGFGREVVGKAATTLAGVNINNDYRKGLKLNFAYLYTRLKSELDTRNNNQRFIGDTTLITASANDRITTSNKHSISSTLTYKPDVNHSLTYTPTVNITEDFTTRTNTGNSYSNFINPINQSVSNYNFPNKNFRFQQAFKYNQTLGNGSAITIDHNLEISPASNVESESQALTSYLSSFPSYAYQRKTYARAKNNDASVTINYFKPLFKKLNADVTLNLDYNTLADKLSAYNYNPVTGLYDSVLVATNHDLKRTKFIEAITPGIAYTFPHEIILNAHLLMQFQQVNNVFNRNSADIDQRFVNLLPNISLNAGNFSASYNKGLNLPNIGDMVPYSVVFNPLYTVTGNPYLKPTTTNNFNLSYNKYNYQTGVNYNVSAGAVFEQNTIFRQLTIDENLAETSTPINRNGRHSYSLSGRYTKGLKKRNGFQFSASTSGNVYLMHDFYILNYQNGYQNNINATLSQQFSANWKDIIEFDPQYTLTGYRTAYTGINNNKQTFLMHNFYIHFMVYWPAHMNLEGNYNYFHNPMLPAGFQRNSNLLSLSLARQFLKKDRGELKLSCYDILNQNIGTTRQITENSISDVQSQVIKRYFMLTLQFKFNKSVSVGDAK